jgi:hypothetical protein
LASLPNSAQSDAPLHSHWPDLPEQLHLAEGCDVPPPRTCAIANDDDAAIASTTEIAVSLHRIDMANSSARTSSNLIRPMQASTVDPRQNIEVEWVNRPSLPSRALTRSNENNLKAPIHASAHGSLCLLHPFAPFTPHLVF